MITKLDFNRQLLGPTDQVLGQSLGELLSNTLLGAAAKPPLSTKYFIWAIELVKSGIIEIDEVDAQALREFIDNSDVLTVLAKGRLGEVFTVNSGS